MLRHVLFSVAILFGTVFIHVACTAAVIEWIRGLDDGRWTLRSSISRALALGALVLLMSLAAFLEASLWAVFYVFDGALPQLGEALYFSLVTLTTLGYGDVVLADPWRLIASFEAANGIILFGWTTALIVAVAHRVFGTREPLPR